MTVRTFLATNDAQPAIGATPQVSLSIHTPFYHSHCHLLTGRLIAAVCILLHALTHLMVAGNSALRPQDAELSR